MLGELLGVPKVATLKGANVSIFHGYVLHINTFVVIMSSYYKYIINIICNTTV